MELHMSYPHIQIKYIKFYIMIVSQTTFAQSKKQWKYNQESLLAKISPIFGFEYQQYKRADIMVFKRKQIKSPKGITLLCKSDDCLKAHNKAKICYINKWSEIIGNRTKINEKLFKKLTESFQITENPEQQEIDQMQKVYRFLRAYRPDICHSQFFNKCLLFYSKYLHRSRQEYKLCRVVINTCLSPKISSFVFQNHKQQNQLAENIMHYLSSVYISPKNCPQIIYAIPQLLTVVQIFLRLFWQQIQLINKGFKQGFITYLISNKFSSQSLSAIIRIILQSHPLNFQLIINHQSSISHHNHLQSYHIQWSVMPTQILVFCQLQDCNNNNNRYSSFRSSKFSEQPSPQRIMRNKTSSSDVSTEQ